MGKMRVRLKPSDLAGYLGSLRVIEEVVTELGKGDVADVGNWAVAYLQDIFPKSANRRSSISAYGNVVSRGTPLWKGWRKYTTADEGFVIRHARMNQSSVATVLAALDQGSKAYTIRLQYSHAFRFVNQAGEVIIRSGGKTGYGEIKIPARQPLPTKEGYIAPTAQFIQEQITYLRDIRQKEIDSAFAKKQTRRQMIKTSFLANLARSRASSS